VGVLEHEQHRLPCGEADQLFHQRLQGPAPALLRGQIQAAVACFSVDPEQNRE
jgi:hypothetical protein